MRVHNVPCVFGTIGAPMWGYTGKRGEHAGSVLHFASEARSSRSTGNVSNVDGGMKDSYLR